MKFLAVLVTIPILIFGAFIVLSVLEQDPADPSPRVMESWRGLHANETNRRIGWLWGWSRLPVTTEMWAQIEGDR